MGTRGWGGGVDRGHGDRGTGGQDTREQGDRVTRETGVICAITRNMCVYALQKALKQKVHTLKLTQRTFHVVTVCLPREVTIYCTCIATSLMKTSSPSPPTHLIDARCIQ